MSVAPSDVKYKLIIKRQVDYLTIQMARGAREGHALQSIGGRDDVIAVDRIDGDRRMGLVDGDLFLMVGFEAAKAVRCTCRSLSLPQECGP
jgi:hypothetical protein